MAPDESEPADAPARSSRSLLAWLAVLVLVVYPLSVGPVVKLELGGKITATYFETFYAPLIYLYFKFSVVHDFYEWYFRLWGIH